MEFKYFEASSHVLNYDRFRPSPPKKLIQRIVKFLEEKLSAPLELAIDVGCGSGQSTAVLSPYFKKVIGIDPSPSIIKEAEKKNIFQNVFYRTSGAETIDVDSGSVDLVTTCQAVHWFELSKFYCEVNRILKQNGVMAVYGYHLPHPQYKDKDAALSRIVTKYYTDVLGEYILPQSKKVYLDNYKNKEFNEVPFTDGMIREENFITEIDATLGELIGYMSTWSGFQNYVRIKGEENGASILKDFENEFKASMGLTGDEKEEKIKIIYKYFLLLGRKQ